jgi:hypothetical protein
MRADTITLGVEEKYSAEERAEIANNLAAAVAEAEAVSGEKKASDAAFNGRIKAAEEKVSALARQYNKGCEVAQIGCDIRYDMPEVGKKSYVRMDTGETVEVHDMSWEEKQDTLQFPLTPPAGETTKEQVNDALDKMEAAGEIPPAPPTVDPPPSDQASEDPPEAA